MVWTVSVVPQIAGQSLPQESGVSLHLPVFVFTVALSLITVCSWAFTRPGKARAPILWMDSRRVAAELPGAIGNIVSAAVWSQRR